MRDQSDRDATTLQIADGLAVFVAILVVLGLVLVVVDRVSGLTGSQVSLALWLTLAVAASTGVLRTVTRGRTPGARKRD